MSGTVAFTRRSRLAGAGAAPKDRGTRDWSPAAEGGTMEDQPPILTVHHGGCREDDDVRNARGWAIVRDGYATALSVLAEDDPDRGLMVRQHRRAGVLAALPGLALQAPLPARRGERPA